MSKKLLMPLAIRRQRRSIDNDFADYPRGDSVGGIVPNNSDLVDFDSFVLLWMQFFGWIKWCRSGSAYYGTELLTNDDLAGDEARLAKIEREAASRGVLEETRNACAAAIRKECERSRNYEANRKPRVKHVAPPRILRIREIADLSLDATLTNAEVIQLRASFLLWIQGPRSESLAADLPQDRARLKAIEAVGRSRRISCFIEVWQ
jgi:hypothetical protein